MNPLLLQFLSESREFLQGIAEKLLQLEKMPDCDATMNELFRLVHTLKGNSGLFEFPDMTRVLHAGEDLMDAVRDGRASYSQELADCLLDAMDFVSELLDEIENNGQIGANHSQTSAQIADSLRRLLKVSQLSAQNENNELVACKNPDIIDQHSSKLPDVNDICAATDTQRLEIYRAAAGKPLRLLEYNPEEDCFFKGEDPFHQVQQIPEILWQKVDNRESWPSPVDLDAYRCILRFRVLTKASAEALQDLFRYTPEQISICEIPPIVLVVPHGDPNGGPVYDDFVNDALNLLEKNDLAGLTAIAQAMLELSAPELWLSSALRWLLLVIEFEPSNKTALRHLILSLQDMTLPDWAIWFSKETASETQEIVSVVVPEINAELDTLVPQQSSPVDINPAIRELLLAQREILLQPDTVPWLSGRLSSVAATLAAVFKSAGIQDVTQSLYEALADAQRAGKASPLLNWLNAHQFVDETKPNLPVETSNQVAIVALVNDKVSSSIDLDEKSQPMPALDGESEIKFGRRAEDAYTSPRTLKVDQDKIDRLMGLIGEMVVAKNSLPYLAGRAESQYGVRELSREIKTQYAVINRIAEEMQDAIMQVRMMPVSFIFQRFPRLVRDTSRKLNKEVNLLLEGESTEADKNIVEALADPLIHIVRNSLDHGLEIPEIRQAAGKPAAGRLIIRAKQESDRVVIEVIDDGKGIDPLIVKQKAYEKGLIDEATMERLSDHEAINLVFAAGFSTAEKISDLSGRGVGMDVVRSAIEKVNGSVYLESLVGKGTTIRLSLPLSMAVTNVMIIEFDNQIFGVPMDLVVETVRVPKDSIKTIKHRQTVVLRGRIVPLLSLNDLLALNVEPKPNEDGELATLVVRVNDEHVGILVDDFRETVDIILKPMVGILGGINGYSGSALLGDGSVLMVLNPKELV